MSGSGSVPGFRGLDATAYAVFPKSVDDIERRLNLDSRRAGLHFQPPI